MNKVIKFLAVPVVLAYSSVNATMSNANLNMQEYSYKSTVIESASLNEQTKLPQEEQTGGCFGLKKAQRVLITDKLLVGEKNNDDNFKLKHYAKIDIQDNSVLSVLENCTLKIQKDGKLSNRGRLELQDGSTLISPTIDMNKDFSINRNSKKILKHGIDNDGGNIEVGRTSKIYWQEKENGDRLPATIYKGTIDFSKLFEKPGKYPSKDNFIMNLEGVKIKLFDPNSTNITEDILRNIDTFKNITLCSGCVLDYKNSNKISEDTLRKMFKNGEKLKINYK